MWSMKSVLYLVGLGLLVIATASPQEKVLGTPAVNPDGNIDSKVTTLQCPAGSYLSGINVHWAGTCRYQCTLDGAVIHELDPICKQFH
jgi:hypothetical protein